MYTCSQCVVFCPLKSHCSFTGPKRYQYARGGAAENAKISPPELSIYIPNISELPERCSDWVNVKLPVDIVLFTVEEVEFLSCYAYLKNPIKSYHISIGIVYFSSMGDEQGYRINIALMRCSKGHDGPRGALSAAKDAILLLKPKALFSVGACSGLKHTTIKLGDVVLSSKLIKPPYHVKAKRNILGIINHIADGWKAPLQNRNGHEAKVHVGALLSISEANEGIIGQFSEAIALDKDGGGENHNSKGLFSSVSIFPSFLNIWPVGIDSKRLFWNCLSGMYNVYH